MFILAKTRAIASVFPNAILKLKIPRICLKSKVAFDIFDKLDAILQRRRGNISTLVRRRNTEHLFCTRGNSRQMLGKKREIFCFRRRSAKVPTALQQELGIPLRRKLHRVRLWQIYNLSSKADATFIKLRK